jgi:hypothetical protein
MRLERNPLYRGPAPAWSRILLAGWIGLMLAVVIWLVIHGQYVFAGSYAVVSSAAAVYAIRRD